MVRHKPERVSISRARQCQPGYLRQHCGRRLRWRSVASGTPAPSRRMTIRAMSVSISRRDRAPACFSSEKRPISHRVEPERKCPGLRRVCARADKLDRRAATIASVAAPCRAIRSRRCGSKANSLVAYTKAREGTANRCPFSPVRPFVSATSAARSVCRPTRDRSHVPSRSSSPQPAGHPPGHAGARRSRRCSPRL